MNVLCVFGKHGYGNPKNGLSTEYASFVPALERLGHQVTHFDSWDKGAYKTYADLNVALLAFVAKCSPDVVFTVQRDYEIWLDTLLLMKAKWPKMATVTWATDDSWKFREVSRFIAPAYDAITTTYSYRLADYHRCGIQSVLLTQWGASSLFLRAPRPARECEIPVSFVGAGYGERPKLVQALRCAGIAVQCFGSGWPSGPVPAESIAGIVNSSAISLNFSAASRPSTPPQIKARTFEAPGAGSLLLTQNAIDLERYYVIGREIDTFTPGDIVEKVRKYLDNSNLRDDMAWAGYRRTIEDHTYEQRLAKVLDFAREMAAGHTRDPLAVSVSTNTEHAHRVSPALDCVRKTLIQGGRMIYGNERGPRAARRAVFEICWRLLGRQTFTAAGFPGRLFPNI